MSANEIKKTHWLLGSFIVLIVLLMAVLMTAMILKNVEKPSEIPTPQALNSSGPLPSRPSSPSTRKPDDTLAPTVIPKKSRTVCKSPECITLAQQLHNWADPSVDPCQDFYKFSCGKYNKHTTAESMTIVKNAVFNQLITDFLDQNLPSTSKSESAIKMYYQKCTQFKNENDQNEVDDQRMKEIYKMMKKIGKWPMIDNSWQESDFNLNSMLSNIAELGKTDFGFFLIHIQRDLNLFIVTHRTMLSFEYVSSAFGRGRVKEFLTDFYRVNNIQIDEQTVKTDMEDVGTLYKKIEDMRKTSKKTVSMQELQKQVPSVDFEKIIKTYMNPSRKEDIWRNVSDKILALRDNYLFGEHQNLETILSTYPKRILANFLILNFLSVEAHSFLYEEESLHGENCALKVMAKFPLAALRIFVRNHLDKENVNMVSELVENFRDNFIETVQESKWLHKTTREKALKKLEMMKKMVGYPKELEAPGALDSFFESLNLSSADSYYVIQNKIEKFKMEQAMDILASVLPIESRGDHFFVNAFYKSNRNSIIINVPMLDDPFFDSTYPEYAKIATIGKTIGHEIGHSFDPACRKYDENGKKNDWWTPEDSTEYNRRTQCLVDQYESYDDPSYRRKLNGTKVLGEMVADLIGINLSWRAYKKVNLSDEQHIFGFEDYDTDKLFYRLAALHWCSGRERMPLTTRTHPTNSFRVNGLYSNMKSFAEAFNCPVGSPMNPKKKCELF